MPSKKILLVGAGTVNLVNGKLIKHDPFIITVNELSQKPGLLIDCVVTNNFHKKIFDYINELKSEMTPPNNIKYYSGFGSHSYIKTILFILTQLPWALFRLNKLVKNNDIIFLRLPNPLAVIVYMYVYLLCKKKKVVLYNSANIVDAALAQNSSSFAFRLNIKRFLACSLNRTFEFMNRQSDCSFFLSEELLKRYPSKKSVIFYNSLVPSNVFNHSSKKYIAPNGLLRVTYLGRLSKEKGIRRLAEMVEIVHDKGLPVLFEVIGDGPLEEYVKSLEEKYGTRFIVYRGAIQNSEVVKFLSNSHFCVLPSFSEGMPKMVFEAIASLTPVLSTRVGELERFFSTYRCGIAVDFDATRWLELLLELKNDDKRYSLLIDQCLATREKFTLENSVSTLDRMIREI